MYPWHMWGKLEFKVQQTDDTSVVCALSRFSIEYVEDSPSDVLYYYYTASHSVSWSLFSGINTSTRLFTTRAGTAKQEFIDKPNAKHSL